MRRDRAVRYCLGAMLRRSRDGGAGTDRTAFVLFLSFLVLIGLLLLT